MESRPLEATEGGLRERRVADALGDELDDSRGPSSAGEGALAPALGGSGLEYDGGSGAPSVAVSRYEFGGDGWIVGGDWDEATMVASAVVAEVTAAGTGTGARRVSGGKSRLVTVVVSARSALPPHVGNGPDAAAERMGGDWRGAIGVSRKELAGCCSDELAYGVAMAEAGVCPGTVAGVAGTGAYGRPLVLGELIQLPASAPYGNGVPP